MGYEVGLPSNFCWNRQGRSTENFEELMDCFESGQLKCRCKLHVSKDAWICQKSKRLLLEIFIAVTLQWVVFVAPLSGVRHTGLPPPLRSRGYQKYHELLMCQLSSNLTKTTRGHRAGSASLLRFISV